MPSRKYVRDTHGRFAKIPGTGEMDAISTELFGGEIAELVMKMSAHEHEQALELFKQTTGREMTPDLVAALVGAPGGSIITVSTNTTDNSLSIKTNNKALGYVSLRYLQTDGSKVINNVSSDFDQKKRGKGYGTRIFARQVQTARLLGIQKIKTYAAGDVTEKHTNGYYTWPRLGFNARLSLEEAESYTMRTGRTATDLHTVMQSGSSGRAWWREYGSSHSVVFDTDPRSPHSQILDAYLEAKGIQL